jgi:hypothetical protein
MAMPTLKEKHEAYLARLKAAGVPTLTYRTPCCDSAMADRPGPSTGQWDSLSMCTTCGELFMKISKADAITCVMLGERGEL